MDRLILELDQIAADLESAAECCRKNKLSCRTVASIFQGIKSRVKVAQNMALTNNKGE